MAVSLQEVADRAGLSRATVSRILNDRGSETRISKATQERVRLIASEIGYKPNRLAQALSNGRTNMIGLMIPALHNPFFLDLLETAEVAALESGYDVMPDTTYQMRSYYKTQGKLSGWPFSGVLAWLQPLESVSDYLEGWSSDTPTVYMGYARTDDSDFVAIDRETGIRQLIDHLIARGHRRIAYLYAWADLRPTDVRYEIYGSVCADHGIVPERIFLAMGEGQNDKLRLITQAGLREASLETGIALAQRPKYDRPDAIVCHNDVVAIGLSNGLARGGVRVPEDIAIAGFDGIDEGLQMYKPLTTVVSPGNDLVRTALHVLAGRLKNKQRDDSGPLQIVLPTVLRIGATT